MRNRAPRHDAPNNLTTLSGLTPREKKPQGQINQPVALRGTRMLEIDAAALDERTSRVSAHGRKLWAADRRLAP